MIDKTVPMTEHATVDCGGMTTAGRRCTNWEWFPKAATPKHWFCHYHRRGEN